MTQTPQLQLIVGAEAIAKALGIRPRQVYAMREAGHPLIRNEPGIGVCMSVRAFEEHFGLKESSP
jgi:hypothetical protein